MGLLVGGEGRIRRTERGREGWIVIGRRGEGRIGVVRRREARVRRTGLGSEERVGYGEEKIVGRNGNEEGGEVDLKSKR